MSEMERRHESSAEHARRRIDDGVHDPAGFRAALLAVPWEARDAWVDRVLGLGAPPADGRSCRGAASPTCRATSARCSR